MKGSEGGDSDRSESEKMGKKEEKRLEMAARG